MQNYIQSEAKRVEMGWVELSWMPPAKIKIKYSIKPVPPGSGSVDGDINLASFLFAVFRCHFCLLAVQIN